ncbi:MAG TPA: J domain-containing protein [Pseudomonadales bacterium]|nr:J domain-containing protein [Pseudomonadales bacterium]
MTASKPHHSQTDLFDASPRPPPAQELRIAPQGAAPLGKEQQTFNRLVRKVEILREKLAEWAAFEPQHHRCVAKDLMPVLKQLGAARRETILTLARILEGKAAGGRPGKVEQRNLVHHLLELARAQLEDDPQDEQIIALHDQYADIGFAEDQELDRELARGMAEQMFGVELEEHELGSSVEEAMAAAAAKARQAAEEEAQAARARRAAGAKARTRATDKAAAAEQAAKEASQSVREVFRKLASALHPDRAGDEVERARRHELMQRVNHAYDEGDLLTLLTLQLETEQIDAAHLARVSTARLGHYNKVLREQLRELEQELAGITGHFAGLTGQAPAVVTPASVQHALKRELAELKRAVKALKAHHAMMQEPAQRKRWLQQYARDLREEERLDGLLDAFLDAPDAFVDMDFDPFRGPGSAPRRGRKRRR